MRSPSVLFPLLVLLSGCGGSDGYVVDGLLVDTIYLAPGESALVEVGRATDVLPSSTEVTEASADTSIVEVVAIDGGSIEIQGVASGVTRLVVTAALWEGDHRYEPRRLDEPLRIIVAEAPAVSALVGTWVRTEGPHCVPFWLELSGDGTYSLVQSENRDDAEGLREQGTWSLEGHVLRTEADVGGAKTARVRLIDGRLTFNQFPFVPVPIDGYNDYEMSPAI